MKYLKSLIIYVLLFSILTIIIRYCSTEYYKTIISKYVSIAHNCFDYGVYDSNNINDYLKHHVGHCGVYSICLAYMLKQAGYSVDYFDIRSFSTDNELSIINHSVVEVKLPFPSCKKIVLDPVAAIVYSNSLEEMINSPTKSLKHTQVCDENLELEKFYDLTFWSSVYQYRKYSSFLSNQANLVGCNYFDIISNNICRVVINGQDMELSKICDKDINTYLSPNDDKENIAIEFEKNTRNSIGLICYDFVNYKSSIKNVKLYYYDDNVGEYIYCTGHNCASKHYEFYVDNVRAHKWKLTGTKIYKNQNIKLDEIILLEPMIIPNE